MGVPSMQLLAARKAAAAGGFAPDDISGCRTWIEPDLQTGFSNGDDYLTAEDFSPAGIDATHSSSINEPTWRSNVINGRAVARFTIETNFPFASHPLSGASAGTLFVVSSIVNDPPSLGLTGAIVGNWGSSGSGEHWPFSDGNIYSDWGSTVRKTVGNPTPAMTSPRIIAIVSAASDWRFYFEGGSAFYSTASNTVGWNGTAPQLGRCRITTNSTLSDIAAVIAYNTALSLTDINQVGDYLADRYDLTWNTAT